MFAWRILQRSSSILFYVGRELHLQAAESCMDHSTRLLSWGQRKLAGRGQSGIKVHARKALTQEEIELIASQTRYFVPPIEAAKLPTFAELAERCERTCSCNRHLGLRRRTQTRSLDQAIRHESQEESICRLLGAMRDRFGGEAQFLALLERLLLDSSASPCVRRAAARALGKGGRAQTIRRRALGQLQRRAEWEGRGAAQLDLISLLS